jgi:hypothetical protein
MGECTWVNDETKLLEFIRTTEVTPEPATCRSLYSLTHSPLRSLTLTITLTLTCSFTNAHHPLSYA